MAARKNIFIIPFLCFLPFFPLPIFDCKTLRFSKLNEDLFSESFIRYKSKFTSFNVKSFLNNFEFLFGMRNKQFCINERFPLSWIVMYLMMFMII